MYSNTNLIYDAATALEKATAMPVAVGSEGYDAIISINSITFAVLVKTEVRDSNKGIIKAQASELSKKTSTPILIVAKYIASKTALELKTENFNYLDLAGNTFIKKDDLLIYISGQKATHHDKTNQARAFQEAGVKLIFNILNNPNHLNSTYRELAQQTGIAIGSVSNILKELEGLNYIFKAQKKRILNNQLDLLNRWIVAYNDVLRPKLVRKRMRFIDNQNWKKLPIQDCDGITLWGGEPAAAIYTGQLRPGVFTVFTNGNWQTLIKSLGLAPETNGDVEILSIFWKQEKNSNSNVVPALLVYADLISSGVSRNIEMAEIILKNELHHFQIPQ